MKKGFSMIEMLVYITVLVFMLAIVLESVFSMASSDRKIKAARIIENSAVLSVEKMEREIRDAESIIVASSTLGTHPGKLVLSGKNASGTARTVEFYLSAGKLLIRENEVELGTLTEKDAQVTNLVFNRFATSTSEGVKIDMTIEAGTSTSYRSEKFYSSAILRNTIDD